MMATFEDFKKLDLRVAEVLTVEPHPQADRLYVLSIRVGEETKQIVAGVRAFYTPQELVGKKIIVVNNLDPATIRGVTSNGMLLAAKDGQQLTVLTLDRDLPSGNPVS
jgi:methionyl-tRNA synthetase